MVRRLRSFALDMVPLGATPGIMRKMRRQATWIEPGSDRGQSRANMLHGWQLHDDRRVSEYRTAWPEWATDPACAPTSSMARTR